MKIKVKDKSQNGIILVRRISWKERCEEQLDQIIKDLNDIKSNLEKSKNELEELFYEQN